MFRRLQLLVLFLLKARYAYQASTCTLEPLGEGLDDTDQIEDAVAECGIGGNIVFSEGSYNVTRKLQWNLQSSSVDLHGVLNFPPNIEYWLDPDNTFRLVFIQSQASWFVLTGSDFVVDAHGTGGIQGNGQPWWEYGEEHGREDGDGRPISLTVWRAKNAKIKNFHVRSPPFWCNTVAESQNIVYDGMLCNATNENPEYFGKNIVPNTDGINTYRSSDITMKNWDITLGDDCLAIKGNSTNIFATNITCRGGNGIVIGSLGQYQELNDIVENVLIDGAQYVRLDPRVQPNMRRGFYIKTWTGTHRGEPPTSGGGATGGHVNNITVKNFVLDDTSEGVVIDQKYSGQDGDAPSKLKVTNLIVTNWTGNLLQNTVVDLSCSPAVGCSGIHFVDYNVETPGTRIYNCVNVTDVSGLGGSCT